jgi:hypothetical protein
MTVRPRLEDPEQVAQAITRHHPPLLRNAGIGGDVLVWLFVDRGGGGTAGAGDPEQRLRGAGPGGAARRRPHALHCRAQRDELVPVWVALPVTFAVD